MAVSLAEPVAAQLRLPASVLLTIFGVAIGALALVLRSGSFGPGTQDVAEAVTDMPLGSEALLFLFLPVLLFRSAMNTDARQLAEDAGLV
ncbi:NhaP-type Na+/H+ or K+/H+ antiporter [Methylopila capsulata]|nr:cation:proton antiporter [Methylopila capsulata]MBM7851445.1 NhaP-type Na+/H+ or K+/H+ antiporter [Methylopila capsulata]